MTPEGADFFQHYCAGRTGSEVMFRHAGGSRWNTSEQSRPMKEACEHGKITPRLSFHILRHKHDVTTLGVLRSSRVVCRRQRGRTKPLPHLIAQVPHRLCERCGNRRKTDALTAVGLRRALS
jgi:hypothetical protein